jgi:hypothetical protein
MSERIFKKLEPVKHTEYNIQRMISRRWLNQAKYLMPNLHYAHSRVEADMLLVRRGSGYTEEFEIKLTTADFKADSNKIFKHNMFSRLFKGGDTKLHFPNRFSYVIGPDVDMTKIEVPEYAGLYRAGRNTLICEKCPPLIHKNKWDWTEKIAKSACFRYLKEAKLIGRVEI